MQILQVRFKNLNSLVGEWEIDFTHAAFTCDGIFAITGPTGAGKTTILDAICLALYGRTPRLNKVTKSENEVMSRQTSDCFAEVTFKIQARRYRCHWSQHRARKKPDGELQAPKHEIADADSGQIFESKIRGVAVQVEDVTGMDFDHFTRSMLLAQGGFAAFLQADPDERAPILEKITGTAIYSEISIRVHERKSDEQKKLSALQAGMTSIQLLTSEDEQQLKTSLEQKTHQDTEFNLEITRKNQAITWIENVVQLEKELKHINEQKNNLQNKIEAFIPEKKRLEAATCALELAGDYSTLSTIRREQEIGQRSLKECLQTLPNYAKIAKLAEETMKTATEQLQIKKLEQQKSIPIIRKVRELDLKIIEKNTNIKAVKNALTNLSSSLETLNIKQNRDCTNLNSKHKEFNDLLQQLEITQADEGLVEKLTDIRSRFTSFQNLHHQLTGKLNEITHADHQFQIESQSWQEQTIHLNKQKNQLNDIQVKLTGKQIELQQILNNQELTEWRKNQLLLTNQNNLMASAIEALQNLLTSKQTIDEFDIQKATLSTEQSIITNQLTHQTEKQAAIEKEIELLETQLILLKKIEHFKELRQQLQDGEPCPLCGAENHPFAAGNVPAPDETIQRLKTRRSNLKSVTNTVSDLKIKLAKISKDFEHITSDQKTIAENIKAADMLIIDTCSKLPADIKLAASDPKLHKKLHELQKNNRLELAHVINILETADSIEMALNAMHRSQNAAKESLVKAERDTQAAVHKKELAKQLLEQLKNEANAYRNEQEKSLALLQSDIHTFTVETLAIDNLNVVYEQLTIRRNQWVAHQKTKTELNQMIGALEIQTRYQSLQIQEFNNELKKQRDQLDHLSQEQQIFVRERHDIFGNKQPDDEETLYSRVTDSADKELDIARQKVNMAHQEFSKLKSRIEELTKAIQTRHNQLILLEETFQLRLRESGFSDEEHFKSAHLSESERKNLAEQSQKISAEKIELTAKEREKIKLIDIERQKNITEEPLTELKNALTALVANLKEIQQEIGGIRQKLKSNENLKQQQQERAQAIDTQKREYARWNLLHELIGSADGKKYRNFAQGLTFEMMIGHANRQLQKMTDRYLLIRNQTQPLELNVIDNYQAGEARSTKNLSGGESFIVSLSLALGLSNMASKNVRVNSLFLDEGFGTLDEEALDTALETLAGLQQDGKLIGVISHVPALKERINTQIQVTPQAGGKSQISGPGCVRACLKSF